jgi:diguanylate cyclase (GGDEF)-like protein
MIRKLIRKLGVVNTTIILTLFVMLLSAILTAVLLKIYLGRVLLSGIAFAIFVPGIICASLGPFVLRLIYQLDVAEERLRLLSMTDDLTRAYNRRHFLELAEKELSRAKRYHTIFSIIFIDIDCFKHINDTYGHLTGDKVLQAMCRHCISRSRKADTFARHGGEEFVYLLPETAHEDALSFARRIKNELSLNPFSTDNHDIFITVSMGVKTYDKTIEDLNALLHGADAALYEAKRRGKNCVVSALELESR